MDKVRNPGDTECCNHRQNPSHSTQTVREHSSRTVDSHCDRIHTVDTRAFHMLRQNTEPCLACLDEEFNSYFTDRGCHVVSATDPLRLYSRYSRPEPLLCLTCSCSIVLTRLSGPRSRPTTCQKIW
jgi:hypothetical protein